MLIQPVGFAHLPLYAVSLYGTLKVTLRNTDKQLYWRLAFRTVFQSVDYAQGVSSKRAASSSKKLFYERTAFQAFTSFEPVMCIASTHCEFIFFA